MGEKGRVAGNVLGALAKLFKPATYRKPELLFRPGQILRRARWGAIKSETEITVETPWGLPVTCKPGERIGEALAKTGSYDTGLLEVMARLVAPGETCLDVGANFGLMAGVLATAAGPEGRVHAFEPHPGLRKRLVEHIASWRKANPSLAEIEVHAKAVSSSAGEATLHLPVGFDANEGTASLEQQGDGTGSITVPTVRLDDVFPEGSTPVGVMKIDIEGHEKAALEGAAGLLGRRAVRDIVYEDHGGYPSAVSDLLEGHGYRVWLIEKGLFGPRLLPPGTEREALPNFIATAEPERATSQMRARGYRVLSGSAFSKGDGSG